ncbi:hypothetical protein [Saccharospirillum mangrovi]|uniref:hypothetical protein n=1 Tax=Saccharospirillum mangrovi TaxID=2161747 RepID=UPI000D3B68C0|nr:hypothetical protein [Saccharospirillum mangrovi]
MIFQHPVLNPNLSFSWINHEKLRIEIFDQEITIGFDSEEKQKIAKVLFQRMSSRQDINEILAEDKAEEIFLQLAKLRLVTEGVPTRPGFVNSLAFQCELEAWFEYYHILNIGESKFDTLFFEGALSNAEVVRFIEEYYQVTRLCSSSVSAAIAQTIGYTDQVFEFFREEYGHEKLLRKSLIELGYSEGDITSLTPRYATRVLMNHLKLMSLTDIESFSSMIFLFEGTRVDADDYLSALELYNLPDKVIKPQRIHEDINSNGDHDLESLHMMKTFGEFSHRKAESIKYQVLNTYSIMHWMNNSLLEG